MWPKIGIFVLDWVLPWLMNHLNKKKAKKLKTVVEVITDGIEIADIIQDKALVSTDKIDLAKKIINENAVIAGVKDVLQKKADKYKIELKSVIEAKAKDYLNKIAK